MCYVLSHDMICLPPGFAMNDSPAGLAAYILEKFSAWTDLDFLQLPDGGLTQKFTLDELITNVMIYWVTGSFTTAARYIKENYGIGLSRAFAQYVALFCFES